MSEREITLEQSKKANDKPAYIILLFPATVTIISYIIFSLFWGDNSPLLYLLPEFLQNFGAVKANAMVLIEQGEIVKSNTYVILYLFTFIYFITLVIISICFEIFIINDDLKKKKPNRSILIPGMIIFIVGVIVLIFFSETTFSTRYGVGRVFKLGLYGLVFYSLIIGVTGYFIAVFRLFAFQYNNRRKYNGK